MDNNYELAIDELYKMKDDIYDARFYENEIEIAIEALEFKKSLQSRINRCCQRFEDTEYNDKWNIIIDCKDILKEEMGE